MANIELSSAGLDERRRRALFRARRRGMREMDLVMGQFADRDLSTMDESELAEFERLLDVADPQILAWIVGDEPTPAAYDTPLLHRLRAAPRGALARKANQK